MLNILFNTLLKHHTIGKKEEEEEEKKQERSRALHDDIRGGSPIQIFTQTVRA